MIKVEDALKTILKSVKTLEAERVKLTDALERVLAEDIRSDSDIPGWDNSAMDGYAVRFLDLRGASRSRPKILQVIKDLKAGDTTKKAVKSNQAIRIMTGAPMPKGADSVVMVEYTRKEEGGRVKIFKGVTQGENIRRAGEDIKRGERVLQKGALLKSADIGILASLGKAQVSVIRRPKVAVLATGDEIIDVGEKVTAGKLRSSNTYTLYSQVLKCGGVPKNLGIAKDLPLQLERKIRQGLDCDLILTSGGVSVGDYDLVKGILAKMGISIRFWKVAMRPGKPLVFGAIPAKNGENRPVFGLPGNPVSSMTSFEIFVRPTILKMLGLNQDQEKEVSARLEEDLKKKKGLRYFLRAWTCNRDGIYFSRTTGPQGSGILKSMSLANSLIILPEKEEVVKKGRRVKVKFLD